MGVGRSGQDLSGGLQYEPDRYFCDIVSTRPAAHNSKVAKNIFIYALVSGYFPSLSSHYLHIEIELVQVH